MEVKDLRLYNLVEFDLNYKIVTAITESSVCLGSCSLYHKDDIKPIPLTEEIILKLGFTKRNKSFHKNAWTGWQTIIEVRKNNYYYKGKHLDSVHELQNLFYALTGDELVVSSLLN